ncbi:hypothetical protein Tco_0776416 [Tanacetum coccineum]
MKHSYSNDDSDFSIDVIDEILEEDFDALLHKGSKILHSIEGTILEEKLFAEFDEFIAMTTDENSESDSETEEPPLKKITFNTDYKIKTSLEEPPSDIELKPLPDNLEYDANLILNWENCHFMVKEGIMLGHKVFGEGLKVDKAKINNHSTYKINLFQEKMESVFAQVVATAKLPVLNPNEFELWKMRIEQYFLMNDYALREVILNGKSPLPTRIFDGVEIIVPPTAV